MSRGFRAAVMMTPALLSMSLAAQALHACPACTEPVDCSDHAADSAPPIAVDVCCAPDPKAE